MQRASLEDRLKGLRCSRTGPIISHLFFADDSLLFAGATVNNGKALKAILEQYSRASGQVINFQKSVICFSKGVAEERREAITSLLGFKPASNFEKYLGLPSFVGRNKKAKFERIKEGVWENLQGWQNRFFFFRGKEVVQAIPIYTMNLYRFPKTLTQELNRLAVKFWWGSFWGFKGCIGAVGISSVKGKKRGGMGFRDLEAFNQALLTKQGWRIVRNPSFLAARLLKGIYFPTREFIEATGKPDGSWLWKSLLWGRQLLQQGMMWRVGSGDDILIYKDQLLPRPTTFKVVSHQVLGEYTLVKDLVTATGEWNVDLLRQTFVPYDMETILGIPLSMRGRKDSRIWHDEKTGIYSVLSGYRLARLVTSAASTSEPSGDENWWKFLWKLSIPSKVKVFLWRLWNERIPTAANLIAHHVPVNAYCFF